MLSADQPAATSGVVLVVEDDFDVLHAIATILEDAGYEVLCAANGAEALRKLGDRQGQCDLIFLDLLMPVMNGWDFRHKQKQTPAFAGIPVVLMSAGAHMATVSGDLEAAGYLTKPVDINDLLGVARRHAQ